MQLGIQINESRPQSANESLEKRSECKSSLVLLLASVRPSLPPSIPFQFWLVREELLPRRFSPPTASGPESGPKSRTVPQKPVLPKRRVSKRQVRSGKRNNLQIPHKRERIYSNVSKMRLWLDGEKINLPSAEGRGANKYHISRNPEIMEKVALEIFITNSNNSV
jgi:hypothetical protein